MLVESEKFEFFCACVAKAFQDVANQVSGLNFTPADKFDHAGQKVSVIVGIVGRNRGRILLKVDEPTAQRITEGMNDGPLEDKLESYLFLGEFTNMVSGKAITGINNAFKGGELRLTPPAIFAGEELQISTPKVQEKALVYEGPGMALIDIGFEGV